MEKIDFSKEMEAIKEKYGERYFDHPKALAEAAILWGCSPNRHGVILDYVEEELVRVGPCHGGARLAGTDKGYWLTGIFATSAFSGIGSAPNVWDIVGYSNRAGAHCSCVEQLIAFFQKVADDGSSSNSAVNRKAAMKAVEKLKAERTPQLSLF